MLAVPWGARKGTGSSLEYCERHPEQPKLGPRQGLNSGRQIHAGAAWAMAVRPSPVSYLSGLYLY